MRAFTFSVWAVLALAAVGLEVAGRRRLGGLTPFWVSLGALRSKPLARAALVVGWMWLGWHLFAR